MKTLHLINNKTALVDDDIYEFLLKYKWRASWSGQNWYAATSIRKADGKWQKVYLHHVVAGHALTRKLQTDHINTDSLDNRRENLRIVTPRVNCSNRKIHHSGKKTSKYVGVCWNRFEGKWMAYARFGSKIRKHLGYFTSELAASAAYQSAIAVI